MTTRLKCVVYVLCQAF